MAGKPQLADSPYNLINAVNALRASYGLAPYSISSILMSTAQGHADYMAATGNVSHTGVGGSSVTDRLLAAGYPLAGDLSLGGFRSENITSGSEGTSSAQAAVNQWTGDAPHLNTMISSNLTEIGAGVTVNGGRVYYVIDCARPTNSGIPQMAGAPVGSGSAITPGGGVIIPVVVVTPNADGDVIHEVKAGQTLWQIAISYETKIDEIKRLNNVFDNNIYPGNKLLIKKDVVAVQTLPVETLTPEVTSSPTSLSTPTATIIPPTPTFPPVNGLPSTSRNNVMGIAMGIIVLALLGGGVVAWLGNSKKSPNI
jgi:LysM repeat protein